MLVVYLQSTIVILIGFSMSKELELLINDTVNDYPFRFREDLIQECWVFILGNTDQIIRQDLINICETFINQNNRSHENLIKAMNLIDPISLEN